MMDALQATMRVAAAGLDAQSRRVRVASENLANAESTGRTPGADPYTRKLISFENQFDEALGADLVRVSGVDLDTAPYRLEQDPSHPAADESGYVKRPNVNMLVEMADIREANRGYQANLQVIKQAREMIAMILDLMRSQP